MDTAVAYFAVAAIYVYLGVTHLPQKNQGANGNNPAAQVSQKSEDSENIG